MKTLFVGNLPSDTTEEELRELFSQHGTVRELNLAADVFTGRCRGFATISMEGHEARAALAALDGYTFKGNGLRVKEERPKAKGRGRGRRR